MQKYIIYDNNDVIYDIADTKPDIIKKFNDSKAARILASAIDTNQKFFMGLADLSPEEIAQFESWYKQ